jgi:hypothetical protein
MHQQLEAALPAAQAGHFSQQAGPRLSSKRLGALLHKHFHRPRMHQPEAHQQPPAALQAVQAGHYLWRAFHKLLTRSSREEADYNYNQEQVQPKRYSSTAWSPLRKRPRSRPCWMR